MAQVVYFLSPAPVASRPWSGSGSSMTIASALMLGVLILSATYTGNLMATLAGMFQHVDHICDTHYCMMRCHLHNVVTIHSHFHYLPSLRGVFAHLGNTSLHKEISASLKLLPLAALRCPEMSV